MTDDHCSHPVGDCILAPDLSKFDIPPGIRAPVIERFADRWVCQRKFDLGGGMDTMAYGATPNEAYEKWFEANTPKWAPGTSPWHSPSQAQLDAAFGRR